MAKRIDLYDRTYGHFTDRVLEAIRKDTYGVDIGQNSWTTADEYDRFVAWLELGTGDHALEVACGSGGPALYLARTIGCRVTGIDSNESGVATASKMAASAAADDRVRFRVADATAPLPFDDDSFDGLLCIDAMNHLPDRLAVLREWQRVLRRGRRAVFTDPVVLTGHVTNHELADRSSIGLFLFGPPGLNEELIHQAGFRLVRQEDVTENAAGVAGRKHRARAAHQEELLQMEGEERFLGLQRFYETVHDLTSQRRLSRIVYLVEKPAA